MLTPEFLRRQAENCLRIARTCFDLASAERLRLMATELNAKADEMDEQEPTGPVAPYHRAESFLEGRSPAEILGATSSLRTRLCAAPFDPLSDFTQITLAAVLHGQVKKMAAADRAGISLN